MVRKRGGGTGQGGGGSKRTATSPPVGAIYKDSRRNIQGGEDFDDEDVVIHNKQKSAEKSIAGNLNQRTVDEVIFEENVIEQMNKASSQRGSVTGTTNNKTGMDRFQDCCKV